MTKKTTYARPVLAKAGSFGRMTAGSLFGTKKEAFWTLRSF
jgi:hypothetical protein